MTFLHRAPLRRSLRFGSAAIVAGVAVTSSFARASATADTFARVPNTSGGTILSGTLGTATLQEATATLMRRIHAEFGKRPTIVQAARNASAHSATLLFTDDRAGTKYTGTALVTAGPGARAAGAAPYDMANRR